MIFDAIVSAVMTVVTWVVERLPTSPQPPGLGATVADVMVLIGKGGVYSGLFPIQTMLTATGVLLGWFLVNAGLRLLVWVLALLHIAGESAA